MEENENDIVKEFKNALQAIQQARPYGGGLSPQQEQLNAQRMELANQISNTPSLEPMSGREQFTSMLQGLSKGMQSSPAAADNYGSVLSGLGAGLVQGVGNIDAGNRERVATNLANQQKNLQLLNATNIEQPSQDIGNAANMANTIVAARQRGESIKSKERIGLAKLQKDMAKLNKEDAPKLEDVLKVKDRYDKETQSFTKMKNYKAVVDAAKEDPTGMKAVGGVYAFLKAIDDGSVVRPSELDLASSSASTLTSAGNRLVRLYEDGKAVPPEVVKQVADAMDVYYKAAVKHQDKINSDYTKFSERYKIPSQDVVTTPVGNSSSDVDQRRQLYLEEKARRGL